MIGYARLREIGEYLDSTFKVRKFLLTAIVILAIFLGGFAFELLLGARMVFAYVSSD